MKKHLFSLFALLCCGFVAFGLTSCLDDSNDDNGLTAEQIYSARQAIRGAHSGKLLYPNSSNSTAVKTDTLDASWSITTDSLMTIGNFPVSSLANFVSNNNMAEALKTAPNQTLSCYYGIINVNPITWLINPMTLKLMLNYSGSAHEVQVVFYANNTYSWGSYNPSLTSRKMQMQIVVAGVYADGMQSNLMSNSIPYVYYAN